MEELCHIQRNNELRRVYEMAKLPEKLYLLILVVLVVFELILSVPTAVDSFLSEGQTEIIYYSVGLHGFAYLYLLLNTTDIKGTSYVHWVGMGGFLMNGIPQVAFLVHIVVFFLLFSAIKTTIIDIKQLNIDEHGNVIPVQDRNLLKILLSKGVKRIEDNEKQPEISYSEQEEELKRKYLQSIGVIPADEDTDQEVRPQPRPRPHPSTGTGSRPTPRPRQRKPNTGATRPATRATPKGRVGPKPNKKVVVKRVKR